MDAVKDAPGAKTTAPDTAAVIEAAHVLSRYKFPMTIVYAVLSGEEQGLLGGKILADYAKAQGWRWSPTSTTTSSATAAARTGSATTTMSGSSRKAALGRATRISPPASAASVVRMTRRRNISRWLDGLADHLALGLDVRQIWRNDRFGRGATIPSSSTPASPPSDHRRDRELQLATGPAGRNGIAYGDTIERMDSTICERHPAQRAPSLPSPCPAAAGADSGGCGLDRTRITWRAVRARMPNRALARHRCRQLAA